MRVSRLGRLGRLLVASGAATPLIVGGALAAGPLPVSAQGTLVSATYSGRACAVQITGLTLLGQQLVPDTCIADSGQVPSTGGVATGPQGPVNVAGLLGLQVLHSSAGGAGTTSNATVRVANVGLVLPANTLGLPAIAGALPILGPALSQSLVSIGTLAADTSVTCDETGTHPTQGVLVGNPPGLGQPSPSGTGAVTLVQSVALSGGTITEPITGQPNQSIDVAGLASLTLNEQKFNAATNTATANAAVIDLHITGVLSGKITIAHTESDLGSCVFSSATPKLPGTGSGVQLTGASTGGSAFDARSLVLPVGLVAMLASAGATLAWRRRRQQLDVERGRTQ